MNDEGTSLVERIHLPWVDQVGLLILLTFLFLGVWRGLWWQVIRLVGVVGAVGLARGLTPRFTPTIEESFDVTSRVASGGVWFVLFLCGLVLVSLLGLVGKRALEAMQLGAVDRFGGALAGALTGLVLHAAFLVVLSALGTPEWSSRTLADTRSAVLLDNLSHKAHVLVDAQAAERIVGPLAGIFQRTDAVEPGPVEPGEAEVEEEPRVR
ncbi:MAG: CvpA family protein [bacterium]|nr:CvpA family protein [bacterium]